jgi:hypothetical protein
VEVQQRGDLAVQSLHQAESKTPFEYYFHREQMGEMDQSSSSLHIFAQMEWGLLSHSSELGGERILLG